MTYDEINVGDRVLLNTHLDGPVMVVKLVEGKDGWGVPSTAPEVRVFWLDLLHQPHELKLMPSCLVRAP